MRIAFADFSGWDLHAQTVDLRPLGGSQSAACYLARALARQGHDVLMITSVETPGVYDGVDCRSWASLRGTNVRSLGVEVLVCLLASGMGVRAKQLFGPSTRVILWTQHAHDQPAVQGLKDEAERSAYDGFVMVSDWQREQFRRSFGLDQDRVVVHRNAVTPAFQSLFAEGEPILAQKADPPVLAYTSTPFRGLDLLLEAFPAIRAAVPGTGLRVFSSMRVYQATASADEAQFGRLYELCRQTEGVSYVGSLPQPELARAMREVMVLAYPNSFAETSCIAVLEALASGCRIVTSDLGALPETTGGFARLVPSSLDREAYRRRFIDETIDVLRECADRSGKAETTARRQLDHIAATSTWSVRAAEWARWLEALCATRHA